MMPSRAARFLIAGTALVVAPLAGCGGFGGCDYPDPALSAEPDEPRSGVFGNWYETHWLDGKRCEIEARADRRDKEQIGELYFREDGRFGVTVHPFETYVDYWGEYSWDQDSEELLLMVDGGNRVPDGIDGEGFAWVTESGALLLEGIWLGDFMTERGRHFGGHRFE